MVEILDAAVSVLAADIAARAGKIKGAASPAAATATPG